MDELEVKAEGTPEHIEAMVDSAISNFEAFLTQSGASPLIKAEKAILKTFLIYKIRKRF